MKYAAHDNDVINPMSHMQCEIIQLMTKSRKFFPWAQEEPLSDN